jgi:RHS repeat-associated protein
MEIYLKEVVGPSIIERLVRGPVSCTFRKIRDEIFPIRHSIIAYPDNPRIDSYEYDAFGNEFTVSGGSNTPNEMMYRGEQYDSDLGLYYLRARCYNPLTGRFMSRDPEDGQLNDPKTLHKYLYAGGDPINTFDPSGRDGVEYRLTLIVGGSAVGALEAFVGGTAKQIALYEEELEATIEAIYADLAQAAAEEGYAALASIQNAISEFNALVDERSMLGGVVSTLFCADIGLVAGEIIDTSNKKLNDVIATVEGTGCSQALTLRGYGY